MQLWIILLQEAAPGAPAAAAALQMLASIVTNDDSIKDSVGGISALYAALEKRLQADRVSVEEVAEVFGFLCRLTLKSIGNKKRCLSTRLAELGVQYITGGTHSSEAFVLLAAGGLLVNLCNEP